MGFWQNVESECEYKGISRKELASVASFSVHTISNGIKRNGMPAVDIALRISRALKVPLEKLLDENSLETTNAEKSFSAEEDIEIKKNLFYKYYPFIQKLESLPPDTTKAVYTIIERL
ncbi:MAG: bacteriophage CI repressor [Spirochaetaceae bacterium]|nr:bacteriophage CI repressor [Spirochaetaceae bacterium]MBQ7882293.1 helix-turn-helix domain-containing protein [Treponema sp.]